MKYKMAYNVAIISPLFFMLFAILFRLTLIDVLYLMAIFVVIMGCIPKEV